MTGFYEGGYRTHHLETVTFVRVGFRGETIVVKNKGAERLFEPRDISYASWYMLLWAEPGTAHEIYVRDA